MHSTPIAMVHTYSIAYTGSVLSIRRSFSLTWWMLAGKLRDHVLAYTGNLHAHSNAGIMFSTKAKRASR